MAIVLDSSVLVGVALSDPASQRAFENAMENGKCYITTASAEEFACFTISACGEQLAQHWITWLFSVDNIGIVESSSKRLDESFTNIIAEAYHMANVTVPAASAAALSYRLHLPVLTSRKSFSTFAEKEFCEVRWAI